MLAVRDWLLVCVCVCTYPVRAMRQATLAGIVTTHVYLVAVV